MGYCRKFSIQVSGSSKFAGIEERMMQVWQNGKNDPYFNQLELRRRMLDMMEIPNYEKLLNMSSELLGMAQQGAGQGQGAPNIAALIQGMIGGGA